MTKKARDLTGQVFGKWVVVSHVPGVSTRCAARCGCGTLREVRVQDLCSGHSGSCGCAPLAGLPHTSGAAGRIKHGKDHGDKVYRTWRNAKNRVSNPRSGRHAEYGGRGIDMDPTWFNSFEAFLAGVGQPPHPDLSLDRKDNERGYWPGNVRWATVKEQARNKRTTIRLEYQGVTKPLIDWCEGWSINYKNAVYRLRRGLTPREVLFGKGSPALTLNDTRL